MSKSERVGIPATRAHGPANRKVSETDAAQHLEPTGASSFSDTSEDDGIANKEDWDGMLWEMELEDRHPYIKSDNCKCCTDATH